MLQNNLTELLHINYPIIQAPMAGGITTTKLVTEVSNAGGLGMIGAGYMTPDKMRAQIREVKQVSSDSFGVNLFIPGEFHVTEEELNRANTILHPIFEELNVQVNRPDRLPNQQDQINIFKEQVHVLIEEKVPVCSFTFGIPSEDVIASLKAAGVTLIGTATTVREAIENEKAGMDIVVVQGSEAGGHRGGFNKEEGENLIGLMALIPQVADRVTVPVVAAGGIMDGRGVVASLCLGAKGVQMGTAFLTCEESGAKEIYKEAILKTGEDQTVLTRSFSGKLARGINNRFITAMQEHEIDLPDFPVQNALTQYIRKTAGAQNNPDYMSLWSGQSPRLAKRATASELIKKIVEEAKNVTFGS